MTTDGITLAAIGRVMHDHKQAVAFIQERYPEWDGTADGSGISLAGCANSLRDYVERLIERGALLTPEQVNSIVISVKAAAEHRAEARVQAAVAAALEMEKVKRERENTR